MITHKITHFPLGNADTALIQLNNGRTILIDYANRGDADNKDDKRCNLPEELKDIFGDSDEIDVVIFTHLDNDHVCGASDFFYLEHASKYQDEDRVKIKEMWVPAAAITEEGIKNDGRVIREEAKHRLKAKKGIKVFSSPKYLKDWADNENLNLDDYADLLVDAGTIVNTFNEASDSIEVFAHSPFASRNDDGELINRNKDSIAINIRFFTDNSQTSVNFFSDIEYDDIEKIVSISEYHDNQDRLEWDIFKVAHHCSYCALAEEKGSEETEPEPKIAELFEEYPIENPLIISSSAPIDENDSDQPPHSEAASYYKRITSENGGDFIVTMEHPNDNSPEPLEIVISDDGYECIKIAARGTASILGNRAPRAGGIS